MAVQPLKVDNSNIAYYSKNYISDYRKTLPGGYVPPARSSGLDYSSFKGVFSMLGQFISGLFNLAGAGIQATSQAQANEAQIEAAKQEAEKAYQRSTPQNQLQELLKLGLSYQQARQIIAGSGNPAVYTPAPIANQMQGVDLAAPFASAGNMLGSITDTIASSYTDPSGGIIGNFEIDGFSSKLYEHLDEIPPTALTSPREFIKWANSPLSPDWCKSEEFRNSLKHARGSLPAQRALKTLFDNLYQATSGEKQYSLLNLSVMRETLGNTLKQIEIDDNTVNFVRNKIQLESDQQLIPLITKVSLQNYKNQLQEAILNGSLLSDPTYRQMWLQTMLRNQENQLITAEILKALQNGTADYLNDPSAQQFIGILNAFKMVGFGGSHISDAVASLTASGINVIPTLQSLGKQVNDILKPAVDAVQNVSENILVPVTKAAENLVSGFAGSIKRTIEGKDYFAVPKWLFDSTLGYVVGNSVDGIVEDVDARIDEFADIMKKAYHQEREKIKRNGTVGYLKNKKFGVKDGKMVFVDEN